MACPATRLTQRLAPGERLRLLAWQGQKAVVPRSTGPAGFDTSRCTTTQARISLPHVPGSHEDPGYRAISLVISITGSNG